MVLCCTGKYLPSHSRTQNPWEPPKLGALGEVATGARDGAGEDGGGGSAGGGCRGLPNRKSSKPCAAASPAGAAINNSATAIAEMGELRLLEHTARKKLSTGHPASQWYPSKLS